MRLSTGGFAACDIEKGLQNRIRIKNKEFNLNWLRWKNTQMLRISIRNEELAGSMRRTD